MSWSWLCWGEYFLFLSSRETFWVNGKLLDFGKKIGETLLDIFKVYCLTKKKLRISVVSFKFSINLFKTDKKSIFKKERRDARYLLVI